MKGRKKKTDEMAEWRRQCRRQLRRSVRERIDLGFVCTYKPVMDDAKFRVFDTMEEYRRWCHEKLPRYLGYRIVGVGSPEDTTE
jgi:hypothetical protein